MKLPMHCHALYGRIILATRHWPISFQGHPISPFNCHLATDTNKRSQRIRYLSLKKNFFNDINNRLYFNVNIEVSSWKRVKSQRECHKSHINLVWLICKHNARQFWGLPRVQSLAL